MHELPEHPDERIPLTAADFPRPPLEGLAKRLLDFTFRLLPFLDVEIPEPNLGSILIVEVWAPDRTIGVIGPPLPDGVESVLLGPWLAQERELAWSREFQSGGYRDAAPPTSSPVAADGYGVGNAWQAFHQVWRRAASGRARVTSWPIAFKGKTIVLRDLWGRRYEFAGGDMVVDPWLAQQGESWLDGWEIGFDLLDDLFDD